MTSNNLVSKVKADINPDSSNEICFLSGFGYIWLFLGLKSRYITEGITAIADAFGIPRLFSFDCVND